jgi:hypothetical protein
LTLILGGTLLAILAFGGGVLTGRATVDTASANGGARAGAGQLPGGGFPSGAPADRPSGEPGELPDDMPSGGPGGFGGGFGGAGGAGFGGTSGQITEIDGDTITIETEEGETYQVQIDSDTPVSLAGSTADLEQGDSITVMGEPDSDGLITDPWSITDDAAAASRR